MSKNFETTAPSASLPAPSGPEQLRLTFGGFPSGVIAVGAMRQQRPTGMVVSSFTSVSLDPALVSICVMNGSRTWVVLRGARRLGLSILGAEQEPMCHQLASRSADRSSCSPSAVRKHFPPPDLWSSTARGITGLSPDGPRIQQHHNTFNLRTGNEDR